MNLNKYKKMKCTTQCARTLTMVDQFVNAYYFEMQCKKKMMMTMMMMQKKKEEYIHSLYEIDSEQMRGAGEKNETSNRLSS